MRNFLLTALCAFPLLAFSQYQLSGRVSDSQNNPVPGATIYFPELQRTVISRSDGTFTASGLGAHSHQIVVTAIGFLPANRVVSPASNVVVEIRLEEVQHQMDEVIVSTGFNKLQSQNVVKVFRAPMAELTKQGLVTLSESLTAVPGVSQISTGSGIGKPVIRGLSSNRVVVFHQGVRWENQQYGDEHGLGLNADGIESVEIIKGPASLMYGPDAMGGVLYLNPEKFAPSDRTQFEVGQKLFSNTLGSSTTIGAKTSTQHWKILGRASVATHSDYEVPQGDRVANTRFRESDVKTGLGYSGGSFRSVFRYGFNRTQVGIPDGTFGDGSSKSAAVPFQKIDTHAASLLNKMFFAESSLDVDLGFTSNERREFEEASEAALDMRLQTLSYDVKYHLAPIRGWDIIAGVQGMYQQNENRGHEVLIPDAEITDVGFFATGQRVFGRSTLLFGLRYDNRHTNTKSHEGGHHDHEDHDHDHDHEDHDHDHHHGAASLEALSKRFDAFNVSAGYKYQWANSLHLRVNVASGFRAPNLSELTSNGVHHGSNRYEIGNASLKNEQNIQFDVSAEYSSGHFEWFANGFYNHVNDFIYLSPNGHFAEGVPEFEFLQADARLAGFEAGLHFHPHPLDWLHFESSFAMVDAQLKSGGALPLIPANTWQNTLRAELPDSGKFSKGFARVTLQSVFDQSRAGQFETQTGGYSLLNAAVGSDFTFGKTVFAWHLSGHNLLNRSYVNHLSRLKPLGIPNMGRNIVLGLTMHI